MRTEVPQRSLLNSPRRRKHAAQEPSGEKLTTAPERFTLANCIQKRPDASRVSPCQHELGRHSSLVDDPCKLIRAPKVQCNGLFEKEGLARQSPNDGHLRLDIRRDGKRESVNMIQHLFERLEAGSLIGNRNLLSGGLPP